MYAEEMYKPAISMKDPSISLTKAKAFVMVISLETEHPLWRAKLPAFTWLYTSSVMIIQMAALGVDTS